MEHNKPQLSMRVSFGGIRTTERSIEGRMSQLSRVFKHGPRSGPATVNHCLRFTHIEETLLTTPEVDTIASDYTQVLQESRQLHRLRGRLITQVPFPG